MGTGQEGFWSWADVREVTVHDVQVRSSTRWLVNNVMDTVLDMATGGGEAPPAFELHVRTDEEKAELTVYTAAVGGYVQSEYELSVALLNRFVDGTADVARLLEWGSVEGDGVTPVGGPRARPCSRAGPRPEVWDEADRSVLAASRDPGETITGPKRS